MITVALHGANRITIRGNVLSDQSSITLHPTGWTIELRYRPEFRRPLQRKEDVDRLHIITELSSLLAEWGVEEDIDDNEILSYVDVIQGRDASWIAK